MATLNFTFKGLMGFVPRIINKSKAMTILLPEVDRPRLSDYSQGGYLLSGHYPFLRFDKKYIVNSSPRKEDFVIVVDGTQEAFVLVRGEELSFDTGVPPSSAGFVEFNEPTAKDLHQPDVNAPADVNKRQSQDMKWLAEMENAYPKAGAVDDDCLDKNLQGLISARLTVVDGVMMVGKLSQQEILTGGIISAPLFEFPEVLVAPEVKQALSEEILLTADSSGVMVISSSELGTGVENDLILLQAIDDKIEITLHNLELEEIIGSVLGLDSTGEPVDFELLYELCASRVPLAGRRSPFVLGKGAGDRICPGGKFALPASDVTESMARRPDEE